MSPLLPHYNKVDGGTDTVLDSWVGILLDGALDNMGTFEGPSVGLLDVNWEIEAEESFVRTVGE